MHVGFYPPSLAQSPWPFSTWQTEEKISCPTYFWGKSRVSGARERSRRTPFVSLVCARVCGVWWQRGLTKWSHEAMFSLCADCSRSERERKRERERERERESERERRERAWERITQVHVRKKMCVFVRVWFCVCICVCVFVCIRSVWILDRTTVPQMDHF